MTISSVNPLPWEVWLAYVRFADHPDIGKVRPVIILNEDETTVVVAKVTTAAPQAAYAYCELLDWEQEGLLRPSRVQTVPLFRVKPSDLLNGSAMGVLSERDRNALDAALKQDRVSAL